ncbi:YceI family protein [Cytophagaceae bacterium DM2B3-1]|uniref:YceI family protein n=1 Tax=Xanthocytophaga flava TaxID=3048013 RepID=A0ABT7CHZ6_9BACT|nr:YceI family protein [Xanthocytophaga flavus]MDJ1468458.1 YceI family protein [Xanthocytophaga flavus]MDJ1493354.1 YceI family protein [Xanthocytophaga flavus]
MKKLNFLFALVALLAIANIAVADNGNGKAAKATLKADVAKSSLNWNGKKVTGEHSGTIKLSNGSLDVNGTKLTGGTFTIDMNSITCTDITDAEYNGKLIGHLKAEDFFDVAKHPTSTFKITKVTAKGGENYDITGDLTVKGITKPVTFPAIVKVSANQAEASGKITIDRTKYDIKYGSKSFFASIGDKAINDDFTVDFKLVATK